MSSAPSNDELRQLIAERLDQTREADGPILVKKTSPVTKTDPEALDSLHRRWSDLLTADGNVQAAYQRGDMSDDEFAAREQVMEGKFRELVAERDAMHGERE